MPKKCIINKDVFINDAKKVHGDFYDYSLVEEVTSKTQNVKVVCPIHGAFDINYNRHICEYSGCPKCVKREKWTQEKVIEKINEIHGDKYGTSLVEYKSYKTKFKLICPEHGEFEINLEHLKRHQGCPSCRYVKSSKTNTRTIEEVISDARKVHGDKYDYSLITEYKNDRIKYNIICPIHGVFPQAMNNHIKGKQGCPSCGRIKCDKNRTLTFEEVLRRSKAAHPTENYIYHKETYKKSEDKMLITCPKHGDFWQKVNNHINLKQGCPTCKQSLLEKEVEQILIENHIKYKYEYNTMWLGTQKLDFYLPDYRIAIECQGIQHFEPVDFGWNDIEKTKEKFQQVLKLDEKKRQKCQENNVYLLYYANYNYNFPYSVITDKQELLTKILNKTNDKN